MSIQSKRKIEKKEAGCVPFAVAIALIIIIMVSVLLALVIANEINLVASPLISIALL